MSQPLMKDTPVVNQSIEIVNEPVPPFEVGQPVVVRRWHFIAGLCLMNGYRRGAELGVSIGRFTMFLCSVLPELHMTAVDLWAEQPNNSGEGAQTYVGWEHEDHYLRFKALCHQFFRGRVNILREDTLVACHSVPDNSLDFVFIDALHTYDGCKNDIDAWYPKVRSGGMISGHDFSESWAPVMRAVKDAAKKYRWDKVYSGPDSVWYHFKT